MEHWESSGGRGHQQWSWEGRVRRSRGTWDDERKMTQEGEKSVRRMTLTGQHGRGEEKRGENGGGHPVAA